jgi:hypothetical protein
MYLPDLISNGTMQSIKSVRTRDGKGIFWQQNEECSGFTISNKNCSIRTSQMELVSYTPRQCLETKMNCDDLVAYVRFDTSDSTISEA